MRTWGHIALAAVLAVALSGCAEEQAEHGASLVRATDVRVLPGPPSLEDGPAATPAHVADGRLNVWFFDVGHGDAALIRSPTGKTLLIDAGPEGAGERLAARLPALLGAPVDLLVVTHGAQEHHGGFSALLQTTGVRQLLLPPVERFPALLPHASSSGLPLYVAQQAQTLDLGGGATLEVQPVRFGSETALALHLRHGETSVLFAPDGSEDLERALLALGRRLRATLLKVASHAEEGPTSEALLAAVRPQAAIVSVGGGNDRGAPSRSVIQRLRGHGAEVFRTDLDGELHLEGDGRRLVLQKERPAVGERRDARFTFGEKPPVQAAAVVPGTVSEPPKPALKPKPAPRPRPKPRTVQAKAAPAPPPPAAVGSAPSLRVPKGSYVASRNGKVFHVPDCHYAQKILERNLVVYRTRKDAERERRPAGDCNP